MVARKAAALPVSQQCRLLAVPAFRSTGGSPEVNDEDRDDGADLSALPGPAPLRLVPGGGIVGGPNSSGQPQAVQRLMRLMGLVPSYQGPNTSKPAARTRSGNGKRV
jgi:hypothetical protein